MSLSRRVPIFCPAVLVIAVAAACGGSDIVLPEEGVPTAITIADGNDQVGRNGAPLVDSVVVQVLDATGRPVVGQRVAFTPTAGGDAVPDTVLTDADGRAAARWQLGRSAGAQQLRAEVVGAPEELVVTFIATAQAGSAAHLEKLSGDEQTATAGSAAAESLVVRVFDAVGNPVPGVALDWTAAQGGSVSAPEDTTDADGRSAVRWVLGPGIGAQTASVIAPGVAEAVTFTATAVPGAAGTLAIVTQPAGTAQSGVRLARQPAVQLLDANGNPVPRAGVAVEAAIASGPVGAATLSSATAATNDQGVATFDDLTLNGPAGTYTLLFGGPELVGVTSSPIAVAAGSASGLLVSPQPSSTAQSGVVFDRQPAVQLVDGSGNPVALAGVAVTAAIASGGGTLQGTLTRSTDASGRAVFTDLAIGGPSGVHTLRFDAGPLSVASEPVSVGTGPVSGSLSELSLTPGAITASTGASSATIAIVARDAGGNPVPGAAVAVTVSGSGNTISTAAPTGADGTTSVTVSSTDAGTKTVGASINGTTIDATASLSVSAAAPSGAQSTIGLSPSGIVVGTQRSTATVTVRDGFGNPVAGARVVLSATGGGTSIEQPGATSAAGVATGTISASTAGTKTVSARIDDRVDVTDPATLTVTKGSTTTTITADDPDPSAPGATITVQFTVAVGSPAGGTPTGQVTVSGGGASCSASVDAGSCALAPTSSGDLTAAYVGDANFSGSSDTESHVVEEPNGAPTAANDAYAAEQDVSLAIAAPGVLANDTDPDGDALSAEKVTDPANGSVSLAADGSFTYTPAPGFSGSDAFTYRAGDGREASAAATVTIEVRAAPPPPPNGAPTAEGDFYFADSDGELEVSAAAGVLANDRDPDGDPLTAVLVDGPPEAEKFEFNADGSFEYEADDDIAGFVSFTYRATDGRADSDPATVTILVPVQTDAAPR